MAKLIPGLKQYLRPDSIEAALEFINQSTDDVKLLAGGTSLAFTHPTVHTIVDITRLPLSGIQLHNDAIEIGATVTIRDLERHPLLQSYCNKILPCACDRLASTPLRNLITVGGNLLGGFPWSDLPVALVTLDTELVIATTQGESIRPIAPNGIVKRHDLIQPGEILTRIRLSADRVAARGAFIKFSRTEVDFGIVVVAVSFNLDSQGCIVQPRVACGSVTPEAMRIPAAEVLLDGKHPCEELFEEAGNVGRAAVTLRADTRAPEDYRREMLGVTITRALISASKGACS